MDTLLNALKTLESSDLIRAAKLEPELEYLFRHGLVQDAAYISLLKQDRRRLHRAVAESIEALYPNRLDDLAAVLAHHYDAAGDNEAALLHYTKAAEAEAARFANQEALAHLTRALELTPEDDPAAQFALLYRRADIYQVLGARSEQRADIDQLRALADQLDDPRRRAETALHQVAMGLSTADYAAATGAVQDAVRWAQQIADPAIEARAQVYWGMILWRQSELEAARPHLMQALEQARAAHLPDVEADSLRSLGIIADYHGSITEALDYLEQALPIYRRIGKRPGESAALNSLGVILLSAKRYDEARHYLEQSLAIKREMGHIQGISVSLGNLGVVSNELADHAAALRYHTESLALCRATDDPDGEAAALAGIAEANNRTGFYAQAEPLAAQSLAISRQIDDKIGTASTLLILGSIVYQLGKSQEALALAEEALALAREIEMPEAERSAQLKIALIHAALGDPASAQAQLQQMIDDPRADKWALLAHAELARLHHTAGAASAALAHIEAVLAALDEVEPQLAGDMQVYLIAWQVLDAAADPRAADLLTRAYKLLQAQAAHMDDPTMRRSFLENVPENREIIAAYHART